MAEAAKLNKDDANDRVDAFSLLEPVGRLTAYPKRLRSFLHDVRVEMRTVNWPSRADVISTTVVVTVTVTFFGLYFFLTDTVLGRAISWLIEYGKKH